jgi:hypothetical protein
MRVAGRFCGASVELAQGTTQANRIAEYEMTEPKPVWVSLQE